VRVNGYFGDILELNDLIGGHASIGNVTAALGVGEAFALTGAQMIQALVGGIEVTARINLGYRQSHQGQDSKLSSDVGIASPGIPNTLGSSVVAGLALGLGRDQIVSALGIAGTMAGWCPAETLAGRGGTIKPIMFGGWPSSVGIQAAKYASHGVTGPLWLLESEVGYYATVARDYDPEIVRGSLGWQLAEPRRKWHACCGYNHAAIDGIAKWRREHGPQFFDNAKIEIGLIDYAAEMMDTDKLPVSVNNARFHAKYCVALAMLGEDIILPEHCLDYETYLTNPALVEAIGRITVRADDSITHYSQCNLRVTGPEGVRAERHVPASKGYPGNPMTDAEVVEKFMRLGGAEIPDADAFVERVLALDTAADISFIARDLAATKGLAAA
jgi:2-methylcitrate dehydratase PrpD